MTRKAIIGTAGRGADGERLTTALYVRMYHAVMDHVRPDDNLVSGGAAVADHLAVILWLHNACRSLTLYLPADFDISGGPNPRFYGSRDAGVANHYHRLFSHRMGWDSFEQIAMAHRKGARLIVVPGFKERNGPVGEVEEVIALTFGTGDRPKDGGTLDTWTRSSAAKKIHISIGAL